MDAEARRQEREPAGTGRLIVGLSAQAAGFRRWLPLAGVVALSVVAHLWGIGGDLPYAPDVDEPIFVGAAVHVASGHLSPGWFGNPGSTTIYPMAALIRLWYAFTDPSTLLHVGAPALAAAVTADPGPYYMIGRLVSAAYGVGSVVLTWFIARRLSNELVATLAALVLPATWTVVLYGQLVRTDTAGMFFALVTLLLILRSLDRQRPRDWLIAGASIGVAISTRYFLAALVIPYLAAVAVSPRLAPAGPETVAQSSRRVQVAGLLAVAVGFALTSPLALVHWRQVLVNLRFEARTVAPGADGLSPLGNLAWYAEHALPAAVGVGLLVAAAVGTIVLARRNPRAMLVVGAFVVGYAIAISASPLHWDRYVVPVVPIVAILAAIALSASVTATVGAVARSSRSGSRTSRSGNGTSLPTIATIATVAIALIGLWPGAQKVASQDRLRSLPSTRVAVTDWALASLPKGALVCEEMYTTYEPTGLTLFRVFALADHSLDEYQARGCRYLISSSEMANRFTDARRYPREAAFYAALTARRPIQTFEPGPDRGGPEIRVYEVADSAGA